MADREPPQMPGRLPSSFDENDDFYNEKPMQKVFRKLKEEPLVPLGIGLTVFAFVNAYRALRRGDSQQANRMFRARVAAQGFTVIAMVAGSMYYNKDREKSKELRKLQEQKDNEEKRQKWIRELEARDEEEKAMRERLQARFQKANEAAAQAEAEAKAPESSGGILSRMGLWPKSEAKPAEETKPAEPTTKKTKSENLGAIGEALASQGSQKDAPRRSRFDFSKKDSDN
ncbi:hypoxia induced protein conserved region-domain-containing protein [Stachybotrys elegans]|uniref:Hypoxia induced protein conserved region-domain-containing protein n=1 Tax=Stachybotrys elegans TaxID=80388 RepID=A0A8K0SNC2_9HYPO|nr:hypoxia induced protein conserved region-domain-containing protein [Stachybotrys elegans]